MDQTNVGNKSRRRSNIFPNFLRNNSNSKEVLNVPDGFGGTIDHDPIPNAEFYENATHNRKSRPTFDDFLNSVKVKRFLLKFYFNQRTCLSINYLSIRNR